MTHILSADIGGTTCKLGIFDESLNILEKWEISTNKTGEGILENIYDSFVVHLNRKNLDINSMIGMGIGVPGPIDFENGVVNGAVNLNWTGNIEVRKIMQKYFDGPIYVDNDANVATLGEKFKGAGQNESEVVCMTLGTGVGGGIVANNVLLHGHNGSGAEIGHFLVDQKKRFKCNCGMKGCLETVASATGVVNLVHHYYSNMSLKSSLHDHIMNKNVSAKDVFDAAKNDDEFSQFIIDKVAGYIAYAASVISVMTNPKYIIIGGGVSNAGDILIQYIEKHYKNMTFRPAQDDTHIVVAKLGNDAGIIGAAGLIKTYVIERENK
ncbi:ROK family glucokinase [Mammaliicoccus stepanovicii]|uniref:Glucokinase n=1 Tax=Mammaliicoccus stepanovicii TaxID=643214 RepID=A0A239Z6H4_9STAP|nr:ROK family glucokinase [Mammaliicoccus stepanovicii]PNZ72745.1 glucokinase [Mammaliicoccus stepanovicii]GGI40014.1 glucokinase [Mammaliicoccus stepanovicii]SNV66563.1 glucokinase [Mammaliicoccus stepanovicii]